MNTKSGDCLRRDEFTGLCDRALVEVDGSGVPVSPCGYEYTRVGTAALRGWGDLDGEVEEWAHDAGAHSVLIP